MALIPTRLPWFPVRGMLRDRGERHPTHALCGLALPSAVLLSLTFSTEFAHAQSAPSTPPVASAAPSPRQQAEVHYERSRAYYAVGRYRAAINELETAIRLDPEGRNLYFDLGLVYERIGDVDRAQSAYRNYLASVRERGERERIERMLSRLRGARNELYELQRPARGRADLAFWLTTAGSVVTAAIGVTVLVVASRSDVAAEELRRAGSQDAARAAGETATVQYITGASLLTVGVGLGATAAALYLAREAIPRNAPLCVSAGPTGVSATLRF